MAQVIQLTMVFSLYIIIVFDFENTLNITYFLLPYNKYNLSLDLHMCAKDVIISSVI